VERTSRAGLLPRRDDPYSALKTTLKVEIGPDAWALSSRLFEKPKHGRIVVKVINHLGDEVMKGFKVQQRR
jgi:adenine-specific DNA-methyltransferase